MKKITLLLVFLLISAPLFWGQLPNWSSPIDTTPRQFFSLVVTQYGYATTISDQSNGWAQKVSFLDTSGNLIWEKNLGRQENTFVRNNAGKMNSRNELMVMLNDTIIRTDYYGNLVQQTKIPTCDHSKFLAIFSGPSAYVIADMGSDREDANVFIYDNDLQYVRHFIVNGPIESMVITNDHIYAISVGYGGELSNASRLLSKYDFFGNIVWEKNFVDRIRGRVCYDGNFIYFASIELSAQKPYQFFTTEKISSSGEIIWGKSWYGDYERGTASLASWTYDILDIPNGGGCIVSGSSTHPGQDTLSPNFNENLVDPISIAYNGEGTMLWKLRNDSGTPGSFQFMGWDPNNYLMIAGSTFDNELGKYVCKVWKFYIDGVTPVEVESNETPSNFSLSQNYPNPFNPSTTINFTMPEAGMVILKVYDVLGKEVATLVDKELNAGTYSQNFDASNLNLSSGIYFYRLETGNFIQTKKMMLVK